MGNEVEVGTTEDGSIMEVQNKHYFQPDPSKLTFRERAVISYWRYSWECKKCGSSGTRLTKKGRANKNKDDHVRRSKKGCRFSDVKITEIEQ